jgi:hypothetical protein
MSSAGIPEDCNHCSYWACYFNWSFYRSPFYKDKDYLHSENMPGSFCPYGKSKVRKYKLLKLKK